MDSTPATAVPNRAERRRLDRKNPAPARGRLYYWRSRRGLLHALVIDPACPWCGEVHTYRAAGLRIAGCGGGYVQIKARKARTAPPNPVTVQSVTPQAADMTRGAA